MASTLITAPQEKNLIRNPIWVTLESDLFTGSAGAYVPSEDNLSCHLEVWLVGSTDRLLATLSGPYSSIDKRISFNIANVLPRGIYLPSEASIGIEDAEDDPLYGEAVGHTAQFYLKYADQYGDPVVTEELTTSDNYLAITGGLPADAVQDINWLGYGIGLHSYYYKRQSSYAFLKPVSPEQPDWMYFVSLVTGDITVTVTLLYENGTSSFYDALTMSVEANKAYWLQSGYEQLHGPDNIVDDKIVVGYNVSLIYSASNFFTVFYILDEMCSPWERYLLMENGIGGYESVRFRGPDKLGHSVTRDTFQTTRWTNFNIQTGDIDDLRVQGSPRMVVNTGHYPTWYLDHLRQMLHGKLWIIDTDEERLKKVRCETNQVELYDRANPPQSLSLTLVNGWLDDGYNVY